MVVVRAGMGILFFKKSPAMNFLACSCLLHFVCSFRFSSYSLILAICVDLFSWENVSVLGQQNVAGFILLWEAIGSFFLARTKLFFPAPPRLNFRRVAVGDVLDFDLDFDFALSLNFRLFYEAIPFIRYRTRPLTLLTCFDPPLDLDLRAPEVLPVLLPRNFMFLKRR